MKYFLDIGGNAGQTFDYLETLGRDFTGYEFFVFEPSPRHLEALISTCRTYHDKYVISVCPFGIGGSSGVRRFYEKDDAMGDSFLFEHASDHAVKTVDRGYLVESYVMDIVEFILTHTKTDDEIILDIDSEGAEYETLFSLFAHHEAWKRVKEIWVEWHHVPVRMMSPEEVNLICEVNKIRIVNRGCYRGDT